MKWPDGKNNKKSRKVKSIIFDFYWIDAILLNFVIPEAR